MLHIKWQLKEIYVVSYSVELTKEQENYASLLPSRIKIALMV